MNFPEFLPFCKIICSVYNLDLHLSKTELLVHSFNNETSNNSLF